MIELLRVFFAARTLLDNLKAGKPLDQEMLDRLDRAVGLVKVEEWGKHQVVVNDL